MSAANRRMTMAWVWPALVLLARLTTAEEPRRDAYGALAGSEALISDSEPPMETRSGGGFLPVLVWKFVKDAADASDLGRPQFLCSDTSLSVRLSLIRYSDLHLQDGRRLAWLQQGCDGSIGTVGPWLLLKLPYTSCHVTSQVSNGTWFHQLKLRYFDHLLRENMTAVVACEDPAMWTLPAVSCRSTEVAVKLPQGSRLQKVKALGKDVVGRVQTTTTPEPVLVQISTPADKDSMFEMIYLDSAGEMSTMLAACFGAARGDGRDRRRRALQHQDQWDWGVNPRHWHNVEPRQMAVNSSEYLDASNDDPSDEDDEELDGYQEDSDEEQSDDEESDDTNNTTANMTDARINSTIAAPTTTLTVEAEETLNSSMPVKPRLGRGLADMETSGDSEEDDDTFSRLGPRLERGLADMETSDDDSDGDGDDEEYDGDEGDYSDDEAEYDDSTTANMTDAQTNATIAASNTLEEMLNTLIPVEPRLRRGMEDMEASDDPENMEDDGDNYDGEDDEDYDSSDEDDYNLDEADYDEHSTANTTEAQTNATAAHVHPASMALNTSMPFVPRLGRGMEDMDSSDPEYMEDESEDDYDSEDDIFLPFEPRLGRGMEASDDPEDMEDNNYSKEDDYDDSEDDYYSEEDDDSEEDSDSTTATMTESQKNATAVDAHMAPTALNTSMPLESRLGRRIEASNLEYMDSNSSGDDDKLSDGSGED